MPNIVDLVKVPELKNIKDLSTPLGKTNEEDGHKWVTGKVIQRLLVHPYCGIMSEIPDVVQGFFKTPPMDAFLGDAFVHTRMGTTYPWIMPKVKIGDQYKHIKPIDVPIFEESDKTVMEFQCSQAIRTGKFGEKLNDLDAWNKITSLYCQQTASAIHNVLTRFFMLFWNAVTSPLTVPIIFDGVWEEMAKKLTAGAAGSQDEILKNLQEQFHGYCQEIIKRGQKIKNRVWYEPTYVTNWHVKADNNVPLVEVKKPGNLGNDFKSYGKALYLEGGNKLPKATRDGCIYAQLSMLGKVISELTSMLPRHTNSVAFDAEKGVEDNTILQACKTTKEKLIVVVSEWDYDDLIRGVTLTGTANKSLSMSSVAEGIQVISIPGIAPGHMYVGEKDILNFFMQLKHTGSIFHWREEETQYYTNFWLAMATFTQMVCGKVIAPCKNYTASPEFYYRFSPEFVKA